MEESDWVELEALSQDIVAHEDANFYQLLQIHSPEIRFVESFHGRSADCLGTYRKICFEINDSYNLRIILFSDSSYETYVDCV